MRAAYWRSLEEYARSSDLRSKVESAFPGKEWEWLPPATRRQFLKLMGASAALAGLAGCRWPTERIVPASRPAGYVPGKPLQFATSMEVGGHARGLLVTSYDGRPIKVEGNPDHPIAQGASDSISQASILELYDPDRSQTVVRRDGHRRTAGDWEAFAAFARERFHALRESRGAGLRVLSEATSSPSLLAMRARFLEAYPEARWLEFESISRDNERAGAEAAFGKICRSHFDLSAASIVLCLDADILMTHPAAPRHARDHAAWRRAEAGRMNRLYAVEAALSLTGSVADHRYPVRQSLIPAVAGRLLLDLLRADPSGASLAARPELSRFGEGPRDLDFVAAIAADLAAHRGRSLVVAGPRLPAEVHALVHLINHRLGNVGRTVFYTGELDPARPSHVEAIRMLAEEMRAGEVEAILLIGGNPVFDAPADLDFAGALSRVETRVRLGLFEDETSRACGWHLPRAHYLESWGDARSYDGTIGIVQPLIAPLYDGRTSIELLSLLVDPSPMKGYDIVRRTLAGIAETRSDRPGFDSFWSRSLRVGVVEGSALPPIETGEPRIEAILAGAGRIGLGQTPSGSSADEALEVVFCEDPKIFDGRFANNGWLQELPDPITKLTWDNAAIVGPATAASLDLRADDVATLRCGGRSLDLPVYVLPGVAAETIVLHLGYGRTAAGTVGNRVGFDVQSLRASDAMHGFPGASLERTGRTHPLACTQNHHAIDLLGLRETHRRVGELVREADLETYRARPAFAHESGHGPSPKSLWKEPDLTEGYQWGMAIDLSACIGCGSCVTACQAENNVPVVGKQEILRGREMHWLRIDRYFSGDPDAPRLIHQPVACVHCENAPCEQVCPVNATVHSEEGLNQMVYNRCVGTRYCSNNCPYKVRRFNWFNNHKNLTQVEKMKHNPEVSVRARGVMEKCTYCVQRIEAAKIAAKNAGRSIEDGEVTPACVQACPARAIVFGNLSDPNSQIAKLHRHERAYGMLAELNTQPRTLYLARLRNPASGAPAPAEGTQEGHHRG